ncbi:MAG TPA: hypothetical protein VFN25_13610 [Dokdonella sp.]|uniref:hypothetical protein n=1 Tax=Dokdonella sp. TaxID=2291710 RepID=UPI002D80EC6D|nr:hypothetical protein [Dokdonella sp.]HET9033926.1 hypothetical protein [Dokdonella sp.]
MKRFTIPILLLVSVFAVAPPPAFSQGTIPSDVAITMTATPSDNLSPGELISFVITATNLGPAAVPVLPMISSQFIDEFDLGPGGSSNCPGIALQVADGKYFFYNLVWDPTITAPLAAGETRVCELKFSLTEAAPEILPFTFGIYESWVDLNEANNSATVILRRGDMAPVTLPMLSPGALMVLLGMLTFMAWIQLRR